jgi:hypothetical protein
MNYPVYPDTGFQRFLETEIAPPAFCAWAGVRTLEQAWAECERADWMLWLASRAGVVEQRKVIQAACAGVRTAISSTTDPRAVDCLYVVERWVQGEASEAEVRQARKNAYAAYETSDVAVAACQLAMREPVRAVEAAAGIAGGFTDQDRETQKARLKQMADLVRKVIPEITVRGRNGAALDWIYLGKGG